MAINTRPFCRNFAGKSVSYDAERKATFLRQGRRIMQALAEAIGLKTGTYEVRISEGGIAVSGEVTLHGETIYCQLSQWDNTLAIMYRRCDGRKDYSGKANQWIRWADLENHWDNVVEVIKKHAEVYFDHKISVVEHEPIKAEDLAHLMPNNVCFALANSTKFYQVTVTAHKVNEGRQIGKIWNGYILLGTVYSNHGWHAVDDARKVGEACIIGNRHIQAFTQHSRMKDALETLLQAWGAPLTLVNEVPMIVE